MNYDGVERKRVYSSYAGAFAAMFCFLVIQAEPSRFSGISGVDSYSIDNPTERLSAASLARLITLNANLSGN